VAVGMSGGVDSAVSALLLKQSGKYEVTGVFMKNWDTLEESGGDCQADKEAADAERICNHIGVPFRHVNFVKEYWSEVFEPTLETYTRGQTPFPDVDCNRHIKFGHFHDYCREQLGCDMVATGHYARVDHSSGPTSQLLRAVDRVKDQTLFLSTVRQDALRRSLFPLGEMHKEMVKKMAVAAGLEWVAQKRESMGICFVGKRDFKEFLDQYVDPGPGGDLIDIDTGKVIGAHEGVHKYTLGQRIKQAGMAEKMYVVDKNLDNQVISVCAGEHHPALYSETFFTHPPHWISERAPRELQNARHRLLECDYRSQNKMPLEKCALTFRMAGSSNWEYVSLGNGLTVSLANPQRALTAGQYAAFYQGEVCLGSAKIERVGPSLYTMNHNNCRTKILQSLNDKKSDSKGI